MGEMPQEKEETIMLHSRSSSARLTLLALLVPVGLFSQPAPKSLRVVSATLDSQTHEVTAQLENVSSKTVVAYALTVKGLHPQGRPVGNSDTEFQFDYIAPEPNPGRANFILPNGISSVSVALAPDAQTSQISVSAVVFEDLTVEGDPGWIFTDRRRRAEAAHQGLKHLGAFPASREENRKAMTALSALGLNPPEEALSKEHWEAIRRDVEAKAVWWDSQKWPKTGKEATR
jgi:hypothetical protein